MTASKPQASGASSRSAIVRRQQRSVAAAMTTAERDRSAAGANPSYTTPPQAGERCPRCHRSGRPQRCALCRPLDPTGTEG